MKSHIESYNIGYRDGRRCGGNMLKIYDNDDLIDKLKNPKLDDENVYYKNFIKSDNHLKSLKIRYESYKEGFYAGCREMVSVGYEEELESGD